MKSFDYYRFNFQILENKKNKRLNNKGFRTQTVARIGLFRPIVIIPSQCPRFFNNERSGMLLICLSLTKRI